MQSNLALFESNADPLMQTLADGAVLLRGFALAQAADLMEQVNRIAAAAPFRHMVTPGGFRMSVAMTNCGRAG